MATQELLAEEELLAEQLIGEEAVPDDRLEALRRVCHNLEAEACAYPLEAFYSLWPWQRLCAQMISLPPLRPLRR